ncbi:DUF2239 family protein [Gluconacetobacter tumulisoli]|uniref:DUF2239 family protein n=1 Tax=Gluconacetobacter tumulisoli TaxID=1286189 RepID=A0A7W4K5F4_9PROT|nr:DUF2239 family protein [Gluconacetobacter tumulisoli]MBB2200743.1 DUF2239 family protein [Gluconacetobacter tumulisoli]
MSDYLSIPCTAFAGTRRIASGALVDVALAIKAAAAREPVLTFDDATGAVIDFDLRGTTAEIVTRLTRQGEREASAARPRIRPEGDAPARPRGRPRLGVVAREVTLLPRHWEWLGMQAGGASQALRRLVDEARRSDNGQTQVKMARERAYRFLSGLAGDLPGFEEAARALFAGDGDAFAARMAAWPPDVRDHALRLACADPAMGKG